MLPGAELQLPDPIIKGHTLCGTLLCIYRSHEMQNGLTNGSDRTAAEAQIHNLLERARLINASATPIHTHDDLLRIVRICDLTLFLRLPELQQLYDREFNPLLKRHFGTVENFLLHRLNWTREQVQAARQTGQYFSRHIDENYTTVRPNDWSYSIPKGFEHWIIWTMLPILNWPKSDPLVQEMGIAGHIRPREADPNSTRVGGPGNQSEPACLEIEAYAMKQWPQADEIFWLVNPVRIQSVPGLAHAHVFVRLAGDSTSALPDN